MAKCVVIGGGFAGLSAAVNLTSKGHTVQLLEASPKLGGRAYSFRYEKQDDIVDNGQHILMGCYEYTLEFLKKINSLKYLDFQQNLSVTFADSSGKEYNLDASKLFYPVNLFRAILAYKAIDFKERVRIIYLFTKIFLTSPKKYSNLNTDLFLKKNKQTSNAISAFWEILHVGTLNCKLSESSAEVFVHVLKKMFLAGNKAATIILPKVGLSNLYCDNAEEYIRAKRGEVFLSTKVESLQTKNNEISSIITDKGEWSDFDYVVLAVSPFNAKKLLSGTHLESIVPSFNYSSILTCHIWLTKNPFAQKFYGLINSKVHWLFNHGRHISLITSSADRWTKSSKEEIFSEFVTELERYFPFFRREFVSDHLILKEKRATFIPYKDVIISRKLLNSKYGKLVLVGDWTNTVLPSTIEGAVKSGKLASDAVPV